MTEPDSICGYLKVTATAEVRDAEGNLISASPVELTRPVTSAELAAHLAAEQDN